MLSSPLNETGASFSLQVNGNSSSATTRDAPQQLGSAKSDGAFAALITLPQLDPSVVILALLTALGLGALHALEPGHGKTAAASYLVGARATPRHAVVLGLTMTAMHTSSVFILGSITLFAARWITPERVLPWLGLASGLIVIALGRADVFQPPPPASQFARSCFAGRRSPQPFPSQPRPFGP